MKLNLGCGHMLLDGYINIDDLSCYDGSPAEWERMCKAETDQNLSCELQQNLGNLVVEDVSAYLHRLSNGSVEVIHSDCFIGRGYYFNYRELARVLQPGGKLIIKHGYLELFNFMDLTTFFSISETEVYSWGEGEYTNIDVTLVRNGFTS